MECPEWAIPFYATGGTVDGEPHWAVLITGTADAKLRRKVVELVRSKSISGDPNLLIVPDGWWREVAHPVYGVTPRFHERYEGINHTAKTIKFPGETISDEDEVSDEAFVKAAWRRSQIADLATFKAVWVAITQEIPRWMVGDLRSVNFGWGELHAFPYRSNWKQIVLSRFPNALTRLRKKELRKSAEETELPALLRNVVNCAVERVNPGRTIFHWTLEITPNPEWFAFASKVESDRATLTNRHGYATSWGSIITRLFPSILKVFHRFVAQTAIPAGALSSGDGAGGSFLVAYTGAKGVRPVGVDLCKVDPVTPDGDELVDDRGRRSVVAKAKNVSSLPVLRFRAADMRDAGGCLTRLAWEGGDAERVLVSNPGSGEGQTQAVLASGDGGGGDGVGGIETPPRRDGAPASQ